MVLSAQSPSQQPTVLFSFYQNNTFLVDATINQVTKHIMGIPYYIEDCVIFNEGKKAIRPGFFFYQTKKL